MTNKDLFKGTTYNSLEEQVGGKHYRSMKIQPAEFINENKLLFAEGNAIKYICRHQSKGKADDIQKAIHYLERTLELQLLQAINQPVWERMLVNL